MWPLESSIPVHSNGTFCSNTVELSNCVFFKFYNIIWTHTFLSVVRLSGRGSPSLGILETALKTTLSVGGPDGCYLIACLRCHDTKHIHRPFLCVLLGSVAPEAGLGGHTHQCRKGFTP